MTDYGYGSPRPGDVWLDQQDRSTAMWAHLVGFVAGPLAFVVPLVIMQGRGRQSPFVREHARESLNFQLTWLIAGVATGGVALLLIVSTLATFGATTILLLIVLGGLVAIAAAVVALVWEVQACLAANAGRPYRYPVSLRLVR